MSETLLGTGEAWADCAGGPYDPDGFCYCIACNTPRHTKRWGHEWAAVAFMAEACLQNARVLAADFYYPVDADAVRVDISEAIGAGT